MAHAHSRRPAYVLLALAGLVLAGPNAGCDCEGGGGTHAVAPDIVVTPDAIDFGSVAVNEETSVLVTVENDGNDVLHFEADPVLTENGEDGEIELAMRAVMTPVDCATGATRDGSGLSLQPGECATLTLTYLPLNLGADTGVIAFDSDDPDEGHLEVPINALGAAPDIEVCVLPGDCTTEEICNEGATPLEVSFPLTELGGTRTCDVRLTNKGDLPLRDLGWAFKSGNRRRDYAVDPEDLGSLGELGPGEAVQAQVIFQPKAGGDKPALLEITSSDPDEGAVTLALNGMGDGPKVCPDPFPAVDFGQVPIGQTVTEDVLLTNCGTMDLEITMYEVQDPTGSGPSPEFKAAAGAPPAPISLAAGESTQVTVEFTPSMPGTVNARFYLESTDPVVPAGWVTLTGEGVVPPSCELQAATTIVDFGTAAAGYPSTKNLAVSNPGELDCTNIGASITAGAGARFVVTGFPSGGPPWTLKPGEIMVFELQYDPADTTGPDDGTLTLSSDDIPQPVNVQLHGTPSPTPECKLEVTPRPGNFSLDACSMMSGMGQARISQFGAVKISQDKTLPVSLTNVGSAPCYVTSVKMVAADIISGIDPTFTLTSGANKVLVNGQPGNQIDPGQVGEVQIRYEPVNESDNCGGLEIQTSDASHPGDECGGFTNPSPPAGCYKAVLKGQGVRSAIEVIPSEMDFGVITVGCASREREVTIYNIGQAPMNITSIYLDPPGKGQPPSGPFQITSVPPLPVTLNGGGTFKIRMKYRPPDANNHNALLVIESDAQNANIMTVPVLGAGTTDSHQTDTFQQLSEPQVDVLWVVDDSCSMSEEQNNIASNAQNFLSRALNLNTDFQIGLVTTDMEDANKSGKLQSRNGRPKIIDRATADPVGAFADNVRQGTSGSAEEQGLEATHSALTDPLINDPAANQGFLRDDAKLVVIAVSDEEDQSTATVDFYVDFLKNLKGYRNSDMMSFSAIVGYDESSGQASDCSSSDGQAVPGARYIDVAGRTGGLKRSICSSNWGQIADDLGLDAFGAKSQFFLSREPIASTIHVEVNGQTVAQSGNWSYEASSQSVIFEPTATPPQSATVVIDYETVCR